MGAKAQWNVFGRTNLGGLKDGLVFPLTMRYHYVLPAEVSSGLVAGSHSISVGLELYIKYPN
jgi:hypothetical protein